ncbi:MAG: quinolinate synthase NadA [Bdellovibrionota bacterium]|nr:quinolinate synthase NadA [Bdellovibrionota bacterium]
MIKSIEQEIQELKKQRNAVILAHYYEDGEIQDIADFTGDSLYLAQRGAESDADVILLAGVVFMGESVKILSPSKTVLVPDLKAGCSLVDSSPSKEYGEWKAANPGSVLISYINCSAEVKAVSDIICTSSNAEKIVNAVPEGKKILFGPDKNLGNYLAKKLNRDMEMWNGSCEVHMQFHAKELYNLIQKNPDAVVLAHPECEPEVLQYADHVGSTSFILEKAKTSEAKKFIIATEDGIFHQIRKMRPDAELIQAPNAEGTCGCSQCPYMKLNTLEKIRDALLNLEPKIELNEDLRLRAHGSLDRMMKISRGESVSFS